MYIQMNIHERFKRLLTLRDIFGDRHDGDVLALEERRDQVAIGDEVGVVGGGDRPRRTVRGSRVHRRAHARVAPHEDRE